MQLNWKIGVEIELIAPKGRSRRDLAEAIAKQKGGSVRPFFHPQVEPSKVSGHSLFNNLTQAFEVVDSNGVVIAYCVDDLTLQDDCDKSHPPQMDWYRIVSDDGRLLQLILQQSNPSDSISEVLTPIADLFGTEVQHSQGKMVRVIDRTGRSIAIAAPLPGERERPCELITAPIKKDHLDYLESLLSIARTLGFTAPIEGATHLHFDATPLQSTSTLANLMRLLWAFNDDLNRLVETNPRCRRLGKWPQELYDWVQTPEFSESTWEQGMQSLAQFEVTKYCNFNLKNMIEFTADKYTFEVRIFPVWREGQRIIEAAGLFEGILYWAINSPKNAILPCNMKTLLNELPISTELCNLWQQRRYSLKN
ncbi:MAG: amidoligase family protein [Methylococcales bacterium]|nr:amidoligase family protein [Methylococcales bacterium]